jgi:lipopolysaccharide/colanic/teichoic acid biosynthesis glycosyltransferase
LKESFYVRYGKRWFDAAASAIGLGLASPFLLLAAIAVKLDSPGPSFFLQTRTGQSERPFRIIKLRTMRMATSSNASLITASGDSRITRLGRWLRKTKLDELPQLLNVIRGDMSLVGPRPEVPKYTALYSEEQKQVFAARPGITGPAAITCVNEEDLLARHEDPERYYWNTLLPAKLELDLAYCRNIGFRRDIVLVCQTLGKLLGRRPAARKPIARHPGRIEELS